MRKTFFFTFQRLHKSHLKSGAEQNLLLPKNVMIDPDGKIIGIDVNLENYRL